MPRKKKTSFSEHLLSHDDIEMMGLQEGGLLDWDDSDIDSRLDEHEVLTTIRRQAHIGEYRDD
jgi:hypothetical protein